MSSGRVKTASSQTAPGLLPSPTQPNADRRTSRAISYRHRRIQRPSSRRRNAGSVQHHCLRSGVDAIGDGDSGCGRPRNRWLKVYVDKAIGSRRQRRPAVVARSELRCIGASEGDAMNGNRCARLVDHTYPLRSAQGVHRRSVKGNVVGRENHRSRLRRTGIDKSGRAVRILWQPALVSGDTRGVRLSTCQRPHQAGKQNRQERNAKAKGRKTARNVGADFHGAPHGEDHVLGKSCSVRSGATSGQTGELLENLIRIAVPQNGNSTRKTLMGQWRRRVTGGKFMMVKTPSNSSPSSPQIVN